MSYELIFLSPLKGFRKLIGEVCGSLGEDNYTVIENFNTDYGKEIAKSLNNQESRAIICKEFATVHLNLTGVPIVYVYANPIDILYKMFIASKRYKKITFVAFWKEALRCNFEYFKKVLDIEIDIFLYRSAADIDQKIEEALESNPEVVLTTGECVAREVRNRNIPAQVIYPSRDVIIEAINRAKEIIDIRKQDINSRERLSKIINAVDDGIILLDQFKNPVLMNRTAEERLSKNNCLTTLISNVIDSSYTYERVVNIDNYQYLVSRRIVTMGIDEQGILITFRDVGEVQRLEYQIRRDMIIKGLRAKFVFDDLVGESSVFKKIIAKAKRYAESDSTILITGESGTGKELFAQSIHNASRRKNNPFVGINCAALPKDLLESELFGYEKGAFTGAEKSGKQGLFECAHKGTIFLDEIAELSLPLQAKLLRVLQEKEVRRIGGDKIIPIDVRVITATNRDLKKDLEEGRFRSDLYYRLNILRLDIPPLRERKEDIPLLISYFLGKHAKQLEKPRIPGKRITETLKKHSWPGNVRELENFCERYLLLADDRNTLEEDVKEFLDQNTITNDRTSSKEFISIRKNSLIEMEKEIIDKLLKEFNGNKNLVAKFLGISRSTLWKKLKEKDVEYFEGIRH